LPALSILQSRQKPESGPHRVLRSRLALQTHKSTGRNMKGKQMKNELNIKAELKKIAANIRKSKRLSLSVVAGTIGDSVEQIANVQSIRVTQGGTLIMVTAAGVESHCGLADIISITVRDKR
jgi:hypothetical protein